MSVVPTSADGGATAAARPPKSYELAAISPNLNEVMAAEAGRGGPSSNNALIIAGTKKKRDSTISDGGGGISLQAPDAAVTLGKEPKIGQGFSSDLVHKNVELKASVMELEELLETTNEVQLEGVNTSKETLSSRCEKSVEAILEYDEEYRCPTSSYISRDKLVDLLGLRLDSTLLTNQLGIMKKITRTTRQLEKSGGNLSPRGSPKATPQQQYLNLGGDGGDHRHHHDETVSAHSARSARSNMSALPAEILSTQPRIEELLAQLNTPEVTSSELRGIQRELSALLRASFPPDGDVLGTCMINLHVTAHTDVSSFVTDQLTNSRGNLDSAIATMEENGAKYLALKEKIDAADKKKQEKVRSKKQQQQQRNQKSTSAEQATEDSTTEEVKPKVEDNDDDEDDGASPEEIEEFDRVMNTYLQSIEKALQISKGRVANVSMEKTKSENNEEDNFRSRFENSQETSKAHIANWREKIKDTQERVDHDKLKCAEEQQRRDDEHAKALEAFHAEKDTSVGKLRNFSVEQDKLWEEVAERVAKMGEITQQRAEEVKVHLVRAEEEHRRRRFYEEFCALNKRHGEHLEMVRALSEESDKILDGLDEFQEHMSVLVEAKNMDDGLLDDLKDEEYSTFVKLYQPYVKTSGVVMGKKDARRLVSEMAVATSDQQLNPGAGSVRVSQQDKKRFQEMRRSHIHIMEAIKSATAQMYDKLEFWEGEFNKVRALMGEEKAGKLEDPAVDGESQWAAAVDRTKQDMKEAFEDEKKVMDEEESTFAAENARAEEAMTKHKQKRESSPPKRSGQLVGPNSPLRKRGGRSRSPQPGHS